MKAVLLGSDLMYTRDGRLVPIEINTNVGYDDSNRIEKNEDWFTAKNLISFLKKHNFTKIVLDLRNNLFRLKGIDLAGKLQKAFPKVEVLELGNVADMEDEETTFFLRVEYLDEAVIDSFCRDKVEFLKALATNSATRQDFVYKTGGEIFGEIKDFQEFDGKHPNYILKYRYPNYNKLDFPAYYKFNSVEELMEAAKEMEDDFFIMPCYLNEDNMWEGKRFVLFRQWSALALDSELGTLTSIDLGSYTKLSGEVDVEKNKWEGSKLVEGRDNYTSAIWMKSIKGNVILEETDEVLMADGTWKKAPEVEEGDLVKSVDVPYKEGVDITRHTVDYEVSEEELREKSVFTENKVVTKKPVESFADRVKITFEEMEEDWWDVETSSYMVEDPKDGTVEFREIKDLTVGDKVYLVDIKNSTEKVEYKKVTIKTIETDRVLVKGYQLTVDGSHLFITKSQEGTSGYISHNSVFGPAITCAVSATPNRTTLCVHSGKESVLLANLGGRIQVTMKLSNTSVNSYNLQWGDGEGRSYLVNSFQSGLVTYVKYRAVVFRHPASAVSMGFNWDVLPTDNIFIRFVGVTMPVIEEAEITYEKQTDYPEIVVQVSSATRGENGIVTAFTGTGQAGKFEIIGYGNTANYVPVEVYTLGPGAL